MATKQLIRGSPISQELLQTVVSKKDANATNGKKDLAHIRRLKNPVRKRLSLEDEASKKHERRVKLIGRVNNFTNTVAFRFLEVGFHLLIPKDVKEREREKLRHMRISQGRDPKLADNMSGASLAYIYLLRYLNAPYEMAKRLSESMFNRDVDDIRVRLPHGTRTIKEIDAKLEPRDVLVFSNGSVDTPGIGDHVVDEFRLRAQMWAGYVLKRPFHNDMEKAIYYNKYVHDNIRYGNSWYAKNQSGILSVDSIIKNGQEVCKGQSAVLNAMLRAEEMDPRYCVGVVTLGPQHEGMHAWCRVSFSDGDYVLDPTEGSYYKTQEVYDSGKYRPTRLEFLRSKRP